MKHKSLGLLILAAILLASTTSGAESPAKTVEKGIVILVAFPGLQRNVDRAHVVTRFTRDLDAYVTQMSYNRVSLSVDVTKQWYRMPSPVGQYKISSRNLEVDKSRIRTLIDDALNAADRDIDFSKYDFAVIYMAADLADYGMIGLCGYPGMLGWGNESPLSTRSGEQVKGVAIYCYQAHLGTLFHDIAHILGGVKDGKRLVPCLYDHDLQAKPGPLRETGVAATINMGFWDPMSCHYRERQMAPPGISSWTKLRLGWMDESKVKSVNRGETAEVLLGPLEDGLSGTLAIKIPISDTTYYLIENRQPLSFDKTLPGSGVLIMYCDDKIAECRHGQSPVKLMDANPSVPHLEGAAFDIGKKQAFQDERNGITIGLKERVGRSYRILISR